MQYKLIGNNDTNNVKDTFLHNRGIKDIERYCNLDSSVVNDYTRLNNIADAVATYIKAFQENKKIHIIVDSDCDGFTSAATIYNYSKKVFPNSYITYSFHTGKGHGLSDDVCVPDDIDFLILPDSGTNDVEQCKFLNEKGVNILILDHHIKERDNPYAIVVNNQCSSEYTNKDLSGVGIVWQLLRAIDDELWLDYSDIYLDLVALGNLADVMDLRSYETKYLIEQGLSQIVNSCLEAFVDGQSFQIKGNLNPHAIDFYISPLINAVCRVGTQEDKDILFKALIGDESETYSAKKKNPETGKFDTIEENVYEHAFRCAKNAKSRQDSAVRKLMPKVKDWIDNRGNDKDSVIFARLPDDVEGVFTGLVAIKIANDYRKPTVILRKTEDGFSGSGRNFDNCPIESFKNLLDGAATFDFVRGHDNAFGVKIHGDRVLETTAYCNSQCQHIDFDCMTVDFSLDYDELDIRFIREIDSLKNFFGTGIKEPIVHISNVVLAKNQGVLIGKTGTTWKFIDDNEIVFLKFTNPEDDPVLNFLNDDEAEGEDKIVIKDLIGKVGFNDYGGILSPQIQVLMYEV